MYKKKNTNTPTIINMQCYCKRLQCEVSNGICIAEAYLHEVLSVRLFSRQAALRNDPLVGTLGSTPITTIVIKAPGTVNYSLLA